MDLREAMKVAIRNAFVEYTEENIQWADWPTKEQVDHILALCSADVVRREREAFVACYDWMSQNGPDAHDPEAEALRRYPEGGKR